MLTAHHQGVSFIQKFRSRVLVNVIRFNREDQITRIVTAVMSLRNDITMNCPFSKGGPDELNFVWKYLFSPVIKYARTPPYVP